MNITLDELLRGKATKIKDKSYAPTEAYVTPFLERVANIPGVSTDDISVKVELPDQITVTQKENVNFDDITYNRVWLQAHLPEEYQVDNHDDVLGMVYGIDTRKPIAKFYRGGLNRACTNLCVFDPSYLATQEIQASKALNYNSLDALIEKTNNIKEFLGALHSRVFTIQEDKINESLGMWVRNCLELSYSNGFSTVKLATSTAIGAYKLLFTDAKSPYFIKNKETTDLFNIYNAFTELISHDKKDIMNECEKVLLLRKILTV